MRSCVIAVLVSAAFATSAIAAERFFVVMDSEKKCSVTSEQPDGKKMQQLSKQAFKTEAEATAAMKTMSGCNK